MKKLALLLALGMALPLAASKNKHKEKSFEPLAVTAAQAAGRYVGIDPDVVLDIRAGGGTFRNFARTATLTHIVFEGSAMTATAVYADGGRDTLEVTFGNQVKNGARTYGLLLRNVDIRVDDDVTLQNLFFRRE